MLLIISKLAKNRVFGAKIGHFLPKNVSGVSKTASYPRQLLELMYYASFHPFGTLNKYRIVLIIQKSLKNAVFGLKMGHFWPQYESEVSEAVFIFVSLKS